MNSVGPVQPRTSTSNLSETSKLKAKQPGEDTAPKSAESTSKSLASKTDDAVKIEFSTPLPGENQD